MKEVSLKLRNNISEQSQSSEPVRASTESMTPRRPWVAPEVLDLPKLTDLTLQTGGGIGGGETVFP
jgi:hypothetical protein